MSAPRGRPFQPGNQFGRGRAKGSRNKPNSPGQHLMDAYGEHLMRKCIASALQGDRRAMRICMQHISPVRRRSNFRMNRLPIKTLQDVDQAAEEVTQAVARGKAAPDDGEKMMGMLEILSRAIEKADHKKEANK